MKKLCENKNICMLDKFTDIKNIPGFNPDTTALILSSVLHEVETYLNKDEKEQFWNNIEECLPAINDADKKWKLLNTQAGWSLYINSYY